MINRARCSLAGLTDSIVFGHMHAMHEFPADSTRREIRMGHALLAQRYAYDLCRFSDQINAQRMFRRNSENGANADGTPIVFNL